MRQGPVLTASLWEPADPSRLARRLAAVADSTSLPVSTETGDLAGCAHLHLWAGELGLGMLDDRSGDWERLTAQLGDLVTDIRPELALVAVEWAASELLDPDPHLLRPGLTCGWLRVDDLGPGRRERVDALARRGLLQPYAGGLGWAADGVVGLDGRLGAGGAPDAVAEAVFGAWAGVRAADAGTASRVVIEVPAATGREQLTAALPAGYDLLDVAGGVGIAWTPPWADANAATVALVEAGVLLESGWAVLEATVRGVRGPVAVWVARPGLLDGTASPATARTSDENGTLWTVDDPEQARVVVRRLRSEAGTTRG